MIEKLIKPLDYEDLKYLKPYFEKWGPHTSDVNLTNLYIWKEKYRFHWLEFEGYIWIINIKENKWYFSQPVGDYKDLDKLKKAIMNLKEELKTLNRELIIKKADESFVFEFKKLEIDAEIYARAEEMDYIYDFSKLKNLSGKKYHKKKNHVNKFMRTYLNWRFEFYDGSQKDDIAKIMSYWLSKHREDYNTLIHESKGILEIVDKWQEHPIRMGLLYDENVLVGFSISEVVFDDMMLIHIEKANTEYTGAYSMLFYQMVNSEKNSLKWINREQDLGIESLRKSKLSYHPQKMIEKYTIKIIGE